MQDYVPMKKNAEFKRTYSKGKSYVTPSLVLYVHKDRKNFSRYGITASKKIGCAVKRNRARRIIKQAFFELSSSIIIGYNLVFVARAKTPFLKSTFIKKDMRKLLDSANILKKESGN